METVAETRGNGGWFWLDGVDWPCPGLWIRCEGLIDPRRVCFISPLYLWRQLLSNDPSQSNLLALWLGGSRHHSIPSSSFALHLLCIQNLDWTSNEDFFVLNTAFVWWDLKSGRLTLWRRDRKLEHQRPASTRALKELTWSGVHQQGEQGVGRLASSVMAHQDKKIQGWGHSDYFLYRSAGFITIDEKKPAFSRSLKFSFRGRERKRNVAVSSKLATANSK